MRSSKPLSNRRLGTLTRTTKLALVGLCFVVSSQSASSQQTEKADPQAESTTACRKEVRSRVNQSHPQARSLEIHRGKIQQWQKSKNEIGFSGEGRVQVRSGDWKNFSFTCSYNARHSQVTGADVQMETESVGGTSSGTGGTQSPGQNSGDVGSDTGSPTMSGTGTPEHGVTLHRDLNFLGLGQTFTSDASSLRGSQVGDDQATSVSVHGGCRARLHRDPYFRGGHIEVSSNQGDLRNSQIGDDSVSSIEVRCDGRSDWSDQDGSSAEGSWGVGTGDSWGGASGSAPYGVTLYRDPDFAGGSETFTRDAVDLWDSSIGNDEASSVRIGRGCRARLYRDGLYRGTYVEIDSDITDLRESQVGDDSISSLQVRCEEDWGGGRDQERYGVTLHRDLQFSGTSESFNEDVRDLSYSRIGNDQATSVSLSRGCRARLYRDTDFRGVYTEINSNIPDLQGSRVGDDSISSLQVRCDR